MESKEVKLPKPGAGERLREKLREIKKNIKPSLELQEITRHQEKVREKVERKIASPRPREFKAYAASDTRYLNFCLRSSS